MSNIGTCRWAFQIQEMYRVGDQPHDKIQRVDSSDEHTCQWLGSIGDLPPPIQRMHGGFSIRQTDCDNCQRYEGAAVALTYR